MSDLRFDGKVALITGAGNGLGRSHALLFASRGASVVVNDLGGGHTGGGKSSAAADQVVEEIKAAGGKAVANYDSVEDGAAIVKTAVDAFGKVDIVVNNAGILRDVTFQKMSQDDWDLIYKVHVLGAYRVTKAAWDLMRDQGFGRVLFTASAAGLYGNFGQTNYSMAKLGLHGMAQTLALEGKKKNVLVNTIAPIAGSRMTETVLPPELLAALKPEYVSALAAVLCHESSEETGGLYEVGGGFYSKLRWERTEGKTFALGRAISPEAVKKAWPAIVDFGKATHPENINEAIAPVVANSQKTSKGGNDFVDLDLALGHEFPAETSTYDERDVVLYALGVGHGKDPSDEGALSYVYEGNGKGFHVDPTFAVIPAIRSAFERFKRGENAPGLHYGLDRILHGEQYVEVLRPLPTKATLTHRARVKSIYDKGKNALVTMEITSSDELGDLIKNEMTMFVRGVGGWGGDRGPSAEVNVAPDRKPDAVVEEKIPDNQTLLYRLSGDVNPLHVDPEFAKAFGFEKPILHGLCTFGFAGRHVVKAFAPESDPRFFKSIKVRFSESVFPGETLVTEMWKESDEKIVFRCKVKERDKVVIANAAVELYKEIPKTPAKPAAKAAAAPAEGAAKAVSGPTASQIFGFLADHVAKNPQLLKDVGVSYVWKLENPSSTWTFDLKNGVVQEGEVGKAECTLTVAEEDFLAMVGGKADPQKLYFGGKLKIAGNVMASGKLNFLAKLDPKALASYLGQAAGGASVGAAPAGAKGGDSKNGLLGAAAQATAPKPASKSGPEAAAVAKALGERLAKEPGLAKEIGTKVAFLVKDPDFAFVADFSGAGQVTEGKGAAETTLTLAAGDLAALARGDESAQALYQQGRLRVDGDLRAAHKLGFLKGLAS